MNRKMMIMICLCLAGGSFLFFIISCSTILSPGETKIAGFVSNVRPARGNPDSHYLLAGYYQERGRHKEAIEEFKKVLLIDPGYVKAYNGMGVSYDMLGDFPRAIECYNYALKLDPNVGYVYNNLGYSYLLQGNLDDAITALTRAIVVNDQDKRFHNNLGLAYAEKGQYDLALAEFKLASDEAKAHYNMAQLYFKKGLFEEAKSHYAMALKINPSLTIVRTGLKAADALARIFEPIPNKAEPKRLVIPDQPIVRTAEMEKPVPSDQSATVNSESGKEVVYNPSTDEGSETNQLASRVQPPMPIDKEEQTVSIDQGTEIKQLTSLKNVGIEISNGNGARRMAKKVGDYLKERGLKVTRLTNANHFRHSGTKIIYQKEYDKAAEQVAEHLPVYRAKEEIERFDRPNIRVKILIGKDLVPHHKIFENGKTS